ncbi:Co/Zn/Cd efflux system component [Sphingomonas desiccabilis]|nr:Co/Zn/Cd efflux system component [Sphingomonas desiccabilis]
MAHDHGPGGHSHDHTAGANAKMLGWALALTSTYLVAEVVGGFVFNSLALCRTTPTCSPTSPR